MERTLPHTNGINLLIFDLCGKTTSLQGFSCDGKVHMQEASSTPYLVSMAIKAAELQGRKAGSKFCENSKNTFSLKMYQPLTANYYLHVRKIAILM